MASLSIYVNLPGCNFIDFYRYSLVKLYSYLTEPAVSEKVRGWWNIITWPDIVMVRCWYWCCIVFFRPAFDWLPIIVQGWSFHPAKSTLWEKLNVAWCCKMVNGTPPKWWALENVSPASVAVFGVYMSDFRGVVFQTVCFSQKVDSVETWLEPTVSQLFLPLWRVPLLATFPNSIPTIFYTILKE